MELLKNIKQPESFDKWSYWCCNRSLFADVYTTSGQIELPSNAKDVEFDLPDVCGYIDWSSREEGVIKTSYQTKKDGVKKKYIKWSFYTIVLVYNAAGAQMWKVLPMDGAKIYLPYNFVY